MMRPKCAACREYGNRDRNFCPYSRNFCPYAASGCPYVGAAKAVLRPFQKARRPCRKVFMRNQKPLTSRPTLIIVKIRLALT